MTEEYEGKLGEERLAVEKLQAEREAAHKEYDETRKQMEEDADREIEVLKERWAVDLETLEVLLDSRKTEQRFTFHKNGREIEKLRERFAETKLRRFQDSKVLSTG